MKTLPFIIQKLRQRWQFSNILKQKSWHRSIIDTHINYSAQQSVEIFTNLIRLFVANAISILFNTKSCMHRCNRNFISFVWSAAPNIKIFWKWQKVHILTILHVHQRRFRTVSADAPVPETVARRSAKRVCRKKSLPPWCDMNETFLQWS